ncbi:radical SAM protein [Reyranella sp. CPCC 100927]|uniref:B12-binding domain-containing radical SAM protein n=1 Tax=Reyranella sp. CPCC 100927 TaxID=2599616 RepID=UPI001C49C1E4|nr:hypothetical protein [Reyranella sp. CPCC 100927]
MIGRSRCRPRRGGLPGAIRKSIAIADCPTVLNATLTDSEFPLEPFRTPGGSMLPATSRRVIVLDLVTKGPARKAYARAINAGLASVMPQVVAAWCEQAGHHVTYICYTGVEDLTPETIGDADVLFINAFTRSALTAYAVANFFRQRGTVTVLGGPHARCYPEDAVRYFDYVLGFTDRDLVLDVVTQGSRHREGLALSATRQLSDFPTLAERWRFVDAALSKAGILKVVPMIGSVGCPYTCSFCIDSTVDYRPLSLDRITEDLRFALTKFRNPLIGWHDPNFGIRFNDYMGAIERAVPRGRRMRHVAETSLSLLGEGNVKRLARNGFVGLLPGIESWYEHGAKSKTGTRTGLEKVTQVAGHINMILRHVPFVQTNFVLGLDSDEGDSPFELTKRFIDLAPGAYPAFSLLTAYGRAAPLNLEFQRQHRVLPFPFHLLDSNHAMNVRPKNYDWVDFYTHAVDLTGYALTGRRVWRRLLVNRGIIPRWFGFVRAISSGRTRYQARIRDLLVHDRSMRRFFDGETSELPAYLHARIKRQLGPLWRHLPDDALMHDPYAYLKAEQKKAADVSARSLAVAE